MKKYFLFITLTISIFITTVYASSSLYTFNGRYDWFDEYNAAAAIENIIDIDNGYLAVGYLNNESLIQFLDYNYQVQYEASESYPYDILYVYECGDNYCAIGASLEGMGYIGIEFTKKGEVIDSSMIYTTWWITKEKTYIHEYNDYLYIFDTSVNNKIDDITSDLVVKVNKNDFTDQGYYTYSELSTTEQKDLKDYFTIIDQYMIDDKGEQAGPIFIHEYKDGFIYGLFDYVNGSNGYVYYYANGGEEWVTVYKGNHISDAIPFKDGILIWDTPNLSYESKLLYCDSSGNIQEEDIIDEYYSDIDNYAISLSYKMIPLKSGFALTSEYHYEVYGSRPIGPDDGGYSVLFFNKYYNIETKTDNNGQIEVSRTTAFSGDAVTFTITPNEGYVLGEVKVTDAYGNVLTFTSNTFTMPSADVTVEVTFIPVEKNPQTSDIAIVAVLSLLLIVTISITYTRRKLKWLK